jgi:hypothetical protein
VVRRRTANDQELLTLLKPSFDNLKTAKTLGLTMPLAPIWRLSAFGVKRGSSLNAVPACLSWPTAC